MEALKRHWRSLLLSRLSELCRRRGGRAVFTGEELPREAVAGGFRSVGGFSRYDMALTRPGETASIRYRGEVWRRRDADL